MVDFADDPTTELERKVRALQWVCVIEAVSYLILLGLWIGGSRIGVQLFGSVHGVVFLAFAAMVLGVFRPMRWSWRWVVLTLCTGPIGAVLVYGRISRQGTPGAKTLRDSLAQLP